MGTVAQGVWRRLEENGAMLSRRFGARYELAGVCVRDVSKKRDVSIPREKFVSDPADIVADPSVDIVCELVGGTGEAREYTLAALRAGKVVVSANKALLCNCGGEIFSAAEKYGGAYFFEASVAGGVPIVKILREGLAANRFSLIYGILNGTCNYILTRMERENASYESVLEDARRLGYVEADESLDVDGWDSAHKIAVLAYLAHGVWIKPEDMAVRGIRNVRIEDLRWADDLGLRVKLVASVSKNARGDLSASVCPTLLSRTDVVANVDGVYNAVSVEGDFVGRTVHIGRGAGRDATASAVVADIGDAVKHLLGAPSPVFPVSDSPAKLAGSDAVSSRFYLRTEVRDEAGVLSAVSAVLAGQNVSIELLEQRRHETEGRAWLMLTTHATTEAAMAKACAGLESLDAVCGAPLVMRMFDA